VSGVKVYRDGRECCQDNAAGRREYKARIALMWERQLGLCAICRRAIALEEATYEHAIPRGHGGGNRNDACNFPDGRWRNAATCWKCNSAKGSKRYEWVDSCFVPIGSKIVFGNEDQPWL